MSTEVVLSARAIIPSFAQSASQHKGDHGRVLVVGGSREYTGAPYYAATSALKTGADLAFVMCTDAAATPIKSYSPELIVHPLLLSLAASEGRHNASAGAAVTDTAFSDADAEASLSADVRSVLDRVHAVVIGPGLGRDAATLAQVSAIIRATRRRSTPTVLDGDALFLVSTAPHLVAGHSAAILTPNPVEFARIRDAVLPHDAPADSADAELDAAVAEALRVSHALGGVAILRKGAVDVITAAAQRGSAAVHADGSQASTDAVETVSRRGSPRRCGGQGDVLAGALGTFLAWARRHAAWEGGADGRRRALVAAASGAAALTRTAARLAFAEQRRATTTPDIIAHIGRAFDEEFPGSLYGALDESTVDVEAD